MAVGRPPPTALRRSPRWQAGTMHFNRHRPGAVASAPASQPVVGLAGLAGAAATFVAMDFQQRGLGAPTRGVRPNAAPCCSMRRPSLPRRLRAQSPDTGQAEGLRAHCDGHARAWCRRPRRKGPVTRRQVADRHRKANPGKLSFRDWLQHRGQISTRLNCAAPPNS